jgi:hypothetical protein
MKNIEPETPPDRSGRSRLKYVGNLLGNWLPIVLLTLGSLWVMQGALALTSHHGIIFSGTDYNAGTVKAGVTVTHDIRVVNLSSSPVQIYAMAHCGCTVVNVPAKPLAPLKGAIVTARVSTENAQKGLLQSGLMLQMQEGLRTWQEPVLITFRLK